ncbi:MAG TPA: M14 family metallopeptidase [Thermoanaerobaculia bacterium]|nr:M14 family metallopeptidase [Thermoanaerobaculia bacterium]
MRIPQWVLLLLLAFPLAAQIEAPLPPAIPWHGKSYALVVNADDPWITPSEKSGFRTSPSYDETVAYLRRLTAAAPQQRMVSIGKSPEGRDIWMIVASKEQLFMPDALHRSGKPTLLAQGGIHAGEIDGKDAGLMLLRDLRPGGRLAGMLDRVNLLFVPILNVDGHERASKFGRINQRGPEVMGWRTNARNLNLNRDYTKLDTEEVRAIVSVIERWQPDLYYDLHVTDGTDYQYDITFGWNHSGYSPNITRWLDGTLAPALNGALNSMGHIPGPLIFPVDDKDLSRGITAGNGAARFSTGYGDVRHVPTMLVENHSLKPYDQRVLGTLVLLERTLDVLAMSGRELQRAEGDDTHLRLDPLPLAWRVPQGTMPPMMDFKAIESRTTQSPISGTTRIEFLGKPTTIRMPVYHQEEMSESVPRPAAYWVPAQWREVIDRLHMHGIQMERILEPRDVDVDMYRLHDPKFDAEPFEGHVRVAAKTTIEHRKEHLPAGSVRIPVDQPLGELAVTLLEPASEDSFLQWGFFHEIFERTEYFENYMGEALAEKMLAADPKLKAEFEKKLESDPAFKASADARLHFFYDRTPYSDQRWMLYPVGREK